MSSYKLFLDPETVTVDAVNSSAASSTVYTLDNLLVRTKPLRIYRSADDPASNDINLYFDVSSATQPIKAIFIDNINVDVINVLSGPTVGSVSTVASSVSVPQEAATGRYKRLLDSSVLGSGISDDIICLRVPSGTVPVAGITNALTLGAVSFYSSSNELLYPGGYENDLTVDIVIPRVTTKFEGASSETTFIGERRVKITLPSRDFLRSSQETDVFRLLNRTAPVVFYENHTDPSRAYVTNVSVSKDLQIQYKVREVMGTGLVLEEVL